MIVSCPGCSREYSIDDKQVDWVEIPNTKTQGVKLLCSSCDDVWWEKRPSSKHLRPLSNKFFDHTDLAFMVAEGAPTSGFEKKTNQFNEPKSRAVPLEEKIQFIKQSPAVTMNITPHFDDKLSGNGRVQANAPKEQEKSRFPYGWFVFFLTLVAVVGAIGFVFFKESLFQKEPEVAAKALKDFVIQNVNYDVRQIDNENIITVVGEIGNPNNVDAPVPALEVLLLGECPASNGENPQPAADSQLCTLYNWSYSWDFTHIHAGEKVSFHTHAKIPNDLIISRVDIDLKE